MALKLKCFRPAVQIWRSTVSVYCSVVQTGVQRPGVKMLPNLHNDDSAQRCNAFMPLNVKVFANLRRLAVQTGVQQHRAKMLLTCTTRLALNIVSMIIFWGTWTYSIDQIGTLFTIHWFKKKLNMEAHTNMLNCLDSKLFQSHKTKS